MKKSFSISLKTVGIVIGILLLIICLFRCIYTVNEQKNAVVTQFGKVVKVNTAGLYFKAPWQSVQKVDMTTHGTGIGYSVDKNGQNIHRSYFRAGENYCCLLKKRNRILIK